MTRDGFTNSPFRDCGIPVRSFSMVAVLFWMAIRCFFAPFSYGGGTVFQRGEAVDAGFCVGSLTRGSGVVGDVSLVWDRLPQETRERLNDVEFGLVPREDWAFEGLEVVKKKSEIRSLKIARFNEIWMDYFNHPSVDLITHVVEMPSGAFFQRIANHRGAGGVDPGFGALGVAWRKIPVPKEEGPGLVWGPKIPGRYSWQEAVEICKEWGGRVPTVSEVDTLVSALAKVRDGKKLKGIYNLFAFRSGLHWVSIFDSDRRNYSPVMVSFRTGALEYPGLFESKKILLPVRCVR